MLASLGVGGHVSLSICIVNEIGGSSFCEWLKKIAKKLPNKVGNCYRPILQKNIEKCYSYYKDKLPQYS